MDDRCPFCGSEDTAVIDLRDGYADAHVCAVQCGRCGAMGPFVSSSKKNAKTIAKELWARRYELCDVLALKERIMKAMEE